MHRVVFSALLLAATTACSSGRAVHHVNQTGKPTRTAEGGRRDCASTATPSPRCYRSSPERLDALPDLPSSYSSGTTEGNQTTVTCTVNESRDSSTDRKDYVAVERDPIGVTGHWLPGANDRACRVVVTSSGREFARQVAREINAASVDIPQRIACPMDDGRMVRLFFSFAGSSQIDEVDVPLNGCQFISAPHRLPREGYTVVRALAAIAPPGFDIPK